MPLYKIRSFGEKIGDTFSFVSENFKPLLKFITYFMLPVSLLSGLAMNGYMNSIVKTSAMSGGASEPSLSSMAGMFSSVGGLAVFSVVAMVVLPAIVYALMRLYGERENKLSALQWDEFKPLFLQLLKRSLKLALVWFLLGIVIMAVCILLVAPIMPLFGTNPVGVLLYMLVLFAILLAILIPLALITPIYLFEDETGLIEALTKSFRLGFKTWAGILGVVFVLYLVIYIVSGVVSIPWMIAMVAKTMFGLAGGEGDGFVNSIGFDFLTYLFSVVQAYFGYVCTAIPLIGLAYQYGHAAEKIDHVTVDTDIEQFETL